jgi:hypothetical protein
MARQTLIDSIESLKDEDFDTPSGFKTDIYLDPEAEKVYTFVGNNSYPRDAHHKIDLRILTVHSGAIPASVYCAIKAIEDILDELIALYKGSEWNGSNHIGQWEPEVDDALEFIHQVDHQIGHYWEPSDWFGPVMSDLKSAWKEGKTAEETIDLEGCGNDQDGMVDRAVAIAWLETQITEWEAEAADGDEE